MSGSIIIKGVVNKLDVNTSERTFGAWASVSVIDKQGDLIPIDEFKPALQKLMQSGRKIQIHDSHTNHPCGEVLSYQFKKHPESGQDGLYIKSKIYNDYDTDTDIWRAILNGDYTGISLGGKAGEKIHTCDEQGCYNLLKDIEVWEFSIVSQPAQQFALIDSVNKLAKSLKIQKAKAYPIQKVRVYVKTPSEAPQGSQIYTGEKGGKYYETEEISNRSKREQIERQLKTPKISNIKTFREIIGNDRYQSMDKYKEGRELKDLFDTYTKISTGTATDEEINRNFEFIKVNLPKIFRMYDIESGGMSSDKRRLQFNTGELREQNYNIAHMKVADNVKKLIEEFDKAKDRKDKIIGIDNFMGIAHTSGMDIVARLWNATYVKDSNFAFVSDLVYRYMDYLRTGKWKDSETGEMYVQKVQVIPIQKYIRQCGDKWCVYSESGKRLGMHPTEEDANRQLRAIEVNKVDLEKEWLEGKISWAEVEKAYRITYETESGNEFIGAKDKEENDKRIKEIKDAGHKVLSSEVLKAKVYVKTPQEAPEGKKVQEGERGGHYYESNERDNQVVPEDNIDATISLDENKYRNLIEKYPYGMYFYYLLNAKPLNGLDSIINLNGKFTERRLMLKNEQYKNKYNNTLEDIKLEMLGDAEKIKDIVSGFNNTDEIKLNNYIKQRINNIMLGDFDSKEIIGITNTFYNTILNGQLGKLHNESMLAWEESSSSVLVLLLKDSIRRQFGGIIRYHDEVKDIEVELDRLYGQYQKELVDKYIQIQKKLTRAYLDAIFPGTNEVTIYRGTTNQEIKINDPESNETDFIIKSNPLSSWTLRKEIATKFAERRSYRNDYGVVLQMKVHKDDIWSTFMSHAYEGNEREILLIGNKDRVATVIWKKVQQ